MSCIKREIKTNAILAFKLMLTAVILFWPLVVFVYLTSTTVDLNMIIFYGLVISAFNVIWILIIGTPIVNCWVWGDGK
jgi:hypothetical protein